MRRLRKESASSTRQLWCYDGRRSIQGADCYVWKRYLEQPDAETGFSTLGYAHPVDTFWPTAAAAGEQPR